MDLLTAKTIVGVAGCVTISIACYITKNALPLWALILVGITIETL